jgi:hypothetical protein
MDDEVSFFFKSQQHHIVSEKKISEKKWQISHRPSWARFGTRFTTSRPIWTWAKPVLMKAFKKKSRVLIFVFDMDIGQVDLRSLHDQRST